MSNFDAVREMYEHFGLLDEDALASRPHMVPEPVETFGLRAIEEELGELDDAYTAGDLAEVSDALVDLVVFAMGVAARHGLPWDEMFEEVMARNMAKTVGNSIFKERNDMRLLDLVKPTGWVAPKLGKILDEHGYTGG